MHAIPTFETYYKNVPVAQKERLSAFRRAHPRQQINPSGASWNYMLAGQGTETLLLLPGGERIGDVAFPLFEHFEAQYRCLYPAYPPLSTMDALLEGLVALLDNLSIERVVLFAASFGGDVGQCFVRKYPQRVSKLILLNTGVPNRELGKATQRSKPLVTLLPMSVLHWLLGKLLFSALAVRPEERLFWQASMRELVANLTRADVISSFDDTVDYRMNYTFSPEDLAAWPGKILILQSDNDPATRPAMRTALCTLYPLAQLHTFHQAGHTPFLSQPDEFYPLIETFLRSR